MSKLTAYTRLLRIPGLGGLGIPAVIGALTVGVQDLVALTILFIIGSLAAIYGFILNDYADVELDRLAKELKGKPLVDGTISLKTAVYVCFMCVMLAFFFLFLLWYGKTLDQYKFVALISIILAGVLGSTYDMYGKTFVGSDVLVAISMSFIFLMGATSFGAPVAITWVIFVLTFNQILHMNIVENGIKDADHDYLLGVKNVALASGVKVEGDKLIIPLRFKALSLGIRLFSAVLLFTPFIFFGYSYYLWQLIILAIATLGVLFFSVKLLSLKKFERNTIRKYIAIQSFLRYALVPIMLIPLIGIIPGVILVIFPFAWYIIFTPLSGEKLLRPRM
jgi:4-hydroxybenzoate polyprenyltransferase